MIGRVTLRKTGIKFCTPFVSTQPGCIACTTVPSSRSAHCSVITISARLERA